MSFLNSIKNNSKQYNFPFDHWEYSNALSEEAIDEIVKADIPDVSKHNLNYDGTRAIDGGAAEFREGIASGGKAIKFRCFINKENSTQFPNLVKFINELQSKETYETISKMINKDLYFLKAVSLIKFSLIFSFINSLILLSIFIISKIPILPENSPSLFIFLTSL